MWVDTPEETIEQAIAKYEGLIASTAALVMPRIEERDIEEVKQILRVKAWNALLAWTPTKARSEATRNGRTPRDRFVFMCVKNQAKDLEKRKKRFNDSLDARTEGSGAADFHARYLVEAADDVYGEVEQDPPLVPSTLTQPEREVLCLLYCDYRHAEIALRLGMDKRAVERHARSLKEKLADWKPSEAELPAAVAA